MRIDMFGTPHLHTSQVASDTAHQMYSYITINTIYDITKLGAQAKFISF